MNQSFQNYAMKLSNVLNTSDWSGVESLGKEIHKAWKSGNQVFFCGNGGSAGNAIHLANDFVYGVAKRTGGGIKALALSANTSVMTCLANDLGYEKMFSEQLAVQGEEGDVLILLSGSGNSPNILAAINQAKLMKIKSFAIVAYDGGQAKKIADNTIHFPISDMQIAEDMQIIVGHMLMQWLYDNKPQIGIIK